MKMHTRFLSVVATTLFITALIASCGGGGGGGYTAPPPTMLNAATLQANGYYFNVHTTACPDGEIRGQIDPVGTTGQETITTTLTNAAEVPTCANGTGSGTGTLVVNLDTGAVVSASITTSGLSGPVTAAHIHIGAAGVAGGIVVTLNIGGGTIGY
jgi:hypothetical protein